MPYRNSNDVMGALSWTMILTMILKPLTPKERPKDPNPFIKNYLTPNPYKWFIHIS